MATLLHLEPINISVSDSHCEEKILSEVPKSIVISFNRFGKRLAILSALIHICCNGMFKHLCVAGDCRILLSFSIVATLNVAPYVMSTKFAVFWSIHYSINAIFFSLCQRKTDLERFKFGAMVTNHVIGGYDLFALSNFSIAWQEW